MAETNPWPMPKLTCPTCGRCGPADRRETTFDYIARDGPLGLRRCRACGTPLHVPFRLFPAQPEAEPIPSEVWEETERALGLTGTEVVSVH
jgi:hypothetical protein